MQDLPLVMLLKGSNKTPSHFLSFAQTAILCLAVFVNNAFIPFQPFMAIDVNL